MTDEERQRAMDFIVQQQAKNEIEIQQIHESFRKAEHRFDRDERILKLMIKAGRPAPTQMREQDEDWKRRHAELMESQAELVESGKHTDRRLDALIDIVRADRNGRTGSV
jgi:tellurite resistance protein